MYGEEKRRQPPYDPPMTTKVLVYGYCVGVFSTRRVAAGSEGGGELKRSVAAWSFRMGLCSLSDSSRCRKTAP